MTRFLLRIPRALYDDMLTQALVELPAECCGVLAGRLNDGGGIGQVTQRYALVNALASPTEFVSEPSSMFAAMKDMRSKGIEILAVYHSHPTSAPLPSRRDCERNYSEGVMNLIIGLAGAEPEVQGWWLKDHESALGVWELE